MLQFLVPDAPRFKRILPYYSSLDRLTRIDVLFTATSMVNMKSTIIITITTDTLNSCIIYTSLLLTSVMELMGLQSPTPSTSTLTLTQFTVVVGVAQLPYQLHLVGVESAAMCLRT